MTEIKDTDICTFFAYNADGFVYRDQEENTRSLFLKTCADAYQTIHTNSSGRCIGERDISVHSFILYIEEDTLKIVFEKRFVFSGKHLFRGTRSMRFHRFQSWIEKHGYTTYDLS